MLLNTEVPSLATFSTLLLPLPKVSAPPFKFHVTLLLMVTALVPPPLPMVKPVVVRVALLVAVTKLPPLFRPTVNRPPETVPPVTLK